MKNNRTRECYGSNPGAQAQAENDCPTCPQVKPCHSAVPLHSPLTREGVAKSKTRVAALSLEPSSRGTPTPTVICGCGGGMLFTRLQGAELDATCTQCWCTITLTPKAEWRT